MDQCFRISNDVELSSTNQATVSLKQVLEGKTTNKSENTKINLTISFSKYMAKLAFPNKNNISCRINKLVLKN